MTALVIIEAVALAGVSTSGLVAGLAHLEMIARVNERLPAEQRFATLGWYPTKTWRLWAEYRRLFPDGALLRRSFVAAAIGVACLAVVWWCLHFAASLQRTARDGARPQTLRAKAPALARG
jgi:hypothetical protein